MAAGAPKGQKNGTATRDKRWPHRRLAQGGVRSAASAAARGRGVGGFSERARCGYNALIGLCPTEGLTGGRDFGAVCLRVLSLGACLHEPYWGNFCARQDGKERRDGAVLAGAMSSGAQRLQRRPGRRLGIVAAQEKGLLRREYEVVVKAS